MQHLSIEEKQHTQIGIASYDPVNCVVINDGFKCGACANNCPAGAITMTETAEGSGQFLPKVDASKCIGCGACEYACPALPKAIKVYGKSVQTKV